MGAGDTSQVQRVKLGSTNIEISELGFGTIAWGDTSRGFGTKYTDPMLEQAFRELVEGGVTLVDTAEVYGYQNIEHGASAEHLVGKYRDAMPADSPEINVATKYFPVPWTNMLVGGGVRMGRQAVVEALQCSLTRLGRSYLDLYQLHFPFPYIGGNQALTEGLAECVDRGLCKAVGVCNYNSQDLRAAHTALGALGVPLASNQVRYNIIDRKVETSGLLDVCKELEITPIAYEPLAQGLLTGKYHEHQHVEGPLPTNQYTYQELVLYRPIINLMRLIGAFNGGKTTSQVALAYLMCKGAVPICGVKNVAQAREVMGATGWRLSETDIEILDERVTELEKELARNGALAKLNLNIDFQEVERLLGWPQDQPPPRQ